ncbi:hypothetical protein F7725_005011 [Dissostichus mawsoni]|uniref:AtuA-like ferredoxin-fold domain-containing protein n=1 Tax=Dissostichus mawsoni TaxID=36200 RepID=A0A7J5XLT8_DISMA|nr:hypothetical protein F7725_005011 [Dissostichus mawsoni]
MHPKAELKSFPAAPTASDWRSWLHEEWRQGDSANIGVIARHPLFFPYLKKHLTSSVVEDYFSHLITPGTKDAVTRYTLPGINGLNFVLQSSLGGGGVASLRSDPQVKRDFRGIEPRCDPTPLPPPQECFPEELRLFIRNH